jgi:hypothetical protein
MLRLLLVAIALGVGGCYSPDEPACSFACGPAGECPEHYSCQADGYCHLRGSGPCAFPDASTADSGVADM